MTRTYAASCYVSLPSTRDGDIISIYDDAIRPAVQENGLEPVTAEDVLSSDPMTRGSAEAVRESAILIADLTFRHPSVMFEVGLRVGTGKSIILIAQDSKDIPVDLIEHRVIVYRANPAGIQRLRKELSRAIGVRLESTRSADAQSMPQDVKASDILSRVQHLLDEGKTNEAARESEVAAARAETEGTITEAATLFHVAGLAYSRLGDYERAEDSFRRSLMLAERSGTNEGVQENLVNLASLYSARGDYLRALELYSRALVAFESQGDQKNYANVLSNMAIIEAQLQRFQEAQSNFEKALQIYESIGSLNGSAEVHNNFGRMLTIQGQTAEAKQHYRLAREQFRQIGARDGEATALQNLGSLAVSQGSFEDALRYFNHSLELNERLGNRRVIPYILHQIGDTKLRMGDVDEAINVWQETLTAFEDLGDQRSEAIVAANLGGALIDKSRVEEALPYLQRAASIFDDLNLPEGKELRSFLADLLTEDSR
jgi:tetratricopeptide (TPR) repeat protein